MTIREMRRGSGRGEDLKSRRPVLSLDGLKSWESKGEWEEGADIGSRGRMKGGRETGER